MRRVLVIGSPGAGKSRFAQELSVRVKVPLIHLDALYHDPEQGFLADRGAWRRHVREHLTAPEQWIMDGHHPATLECRIEACDTVIYLDYPTRICLARVLRRRLRPPSHRPDMPAGWSERLSGELLRTIVTFQRAEAPRVRMLLDLHGNGCRVVMLRHPREAAAFLASLSTAT